MSEEGIAYIGEIRKDQSDKSGKQNRFIKSEAKRTLFCADNYYKAVMSHFICGLVSGGFLFLTFYIPGFINNLFSGYLSERSVTALSCTVNAVLYVLFSFFAFAFFSGAYILASRMKDEPDRERGAPKYASLSAVLIPLNNLKNARRTLCIYLILAAELAVPVVMTVLAFSYIGMLEINVVFVILIKTAVALCSAFVCLFFIMLLVPMPYIMAENKKASAPELYKKSASAALCGMRRCYALLLSFLPLILLSVLTFGMLFYAYTLPYMTVSYAKVGEYLYYLENPERK